MNITVHVVDSDDEDRTFSNEEVTIYYKPTNTFGDTRSCFLEDTDDDGDAVFVIDDVEIDTREDIIIEVRGEEFGPYSVEDDGEFFFTVPI